ncbi:hypothetical protein ACI2S3_24295 [Ralstonia nicotianae]
MRSAKVSQAESSLRHAALMLEVRDAEFDPSVLALLVQAGETTPDASSIC